MNNPNNLPPIPPPIAPLASTPGMRTSLEWTGAPPIVKRWAYPLTWLSIIFIPVLMLIIIPRNVQPNIENLVEKVIVIVFMSLVLGVALWQNNALKKGISLGWETQVVLSILGLFGFPLGTLINVYILSQWFKPETKRWFGKV